MRVPDAGSHLQTVSLLLADRTVVLCQLFTESEREHGFGDPDLTPAQPHGRRRQQCSQWHFVPLRVWVHGDSAHRGTAQPLSSHGPRWQSPAGAPGFPLVGSSRLLIPEQVPLEPVQEGPALL